MPCLFSIQPRLETLFYNFGTLVGRYPRWTIAISIACSLLLSLGALRVRFLTNFDYLMAPMGCRAYTEEKIVQSLFPINTSLNFDVYRTLNRGRFGSLIALPKDGGNMLRESIFNELLALDKAIKSFSITVENVNYSYRELCAKNDGSCWFNNVLTYNNIREVEKRLAFVKFPVYIDTVQSIVNISAINLGGVTADEDNNVLEAKAIRLFYFLDNSHPETEKILEEWEEKFLNFISEYKSDIVVLQRFISSTFDTEVWSFAVKALNIGWITLIVITTFCVVSSMTSNWARSKPWLGLCGCASVGLAICASFGTIMACGLECVPINIAVPFLILGIGVDDMFVLIAAWRITDPQKSVEQRMGDAFSKAAVSVSMTSLTNLISFLFGALTPFPALQIFCIYSAVAIVFDFIYQITFFGACMAMDGRREQCQLHPITFQPLNTTVESTNRGRLYQILFTDKSEIQNVTPPLLMIWCRDRLGCWMGKTSVMICILMVYLIYLGGAAWSLTTLREGQTHDEVFPPDSYASSFVVNYYHYFTQYPHQVQVVINATLDYSNTTVQKEVLDTIDRFTQTPFVFNIGMNWLKYYLDFISDQQFWLYKTRYNVSNPRDFVQCLQDVFLRHSAAKMFKQDIIFHPDGIHITASRFVIFTKDITDSAKEKAMLIKLRYVADSSRLPVTVQNLWWINYEQYLILRRLTMQSVGVATIATMFVFALFLPHFPSVVCVTLTIMSIEFGAIGYMASCGVALNSISAIVLIISIGFCVDYSAHISCSYMLAKGTYQDRIKQSLFASAMPILQGSLSTICSVLILATIPSFMIQAFCRIILLAIPIAFLHSIFILPTFLSMWDIVSRSLTKAFKKSERFKPELEPMATVNADSAT